MNNDYQPTMAYTTAFCFGLVEELWITKVLIMYTNEPQNKQETITKERSFPMAPRQFK